MSKKWSPLQVAIFDMIGDGSGNAIIRAVAGSGKSTTIVEGMSRIPAGLTSIFLAFNRDIADELKARGVNARTFHSLCYTPVLKLKGQKQAEMDKLHKLCKQNMTGDDFYLYASFAKRLVGLARQVGIGCLVDDTDEAWMDIVAHHDLEPESDNADLGRAIALSRDLLTWSNQSTMVDFDDMLYWAVKEGVSLPKFDFVFVDEAQDTNAIQRAILRKIIRKGGRLVAVGDPAQAIYGFRGADSESMNVLQREFECKTLPLDITYRCAKSIVEYAQQWVPNIHAAETAPDGVVADIEFKEAFKEMRTGDLVVCRLSAPLITLAYRLMRERRPVQILGRDIGAGLKGLVKKMDTQNVDELCKRLDAYCEREVEKAGAKGNESKVQSIYDRVESVQFLANTLEEGNRTVDALYRRIDELFADKAGAVRLSTIHKSKGLEADRVFWLNRKDCPPRWVRQEWQFQQEINLCYVAATRAKSALYLFALPK